jgi:UDP-3-O-[3-hydroxymyristoyl] glucosamine N-acyltransferase
VLFPGVYIGPGSVIGAHCTLHPNVVVQEEVTIGDRVILHPGVVIGSDGFGYATGQDGVHTKIPQVGRVVIEDDVEIGANTCVDRARLAETRIGRGTKIDNLVQVGHNVHMGQGCLIVAQAGVAGSTKLGRNVVLGGHVGVAGHLELGDGAQVSAFSGVGNNLEGGRGYMGVPARPIAEGKKVRVLSLRLPEIYERLKAAEEALRRIGALEQKERDL